MPVIALVVGTRPEIIKISPLPRAAAALGMRCRIVHTGQHYDDALDGVFFRELEVPEPDANLRSGTAAGGASLAAMLAGCERELARARPDWVVVQGDTNSTLAGALASKQLGLRLAHLEAGLRCGDRALPEERNRIVADHLADVLFAPTELQRGPLLAEGIDRARIHVIGNTIADVVHARLASGLDDRALDAHGVAPRGYGFATVHRQGNVESSERLAPLLEGLGLVAAEIGVPILLPAHPRTARRLAELRIPRGVRVLAPLGHRDCLALQRGARLVLTDSGGLQEEACLLQVPCVTLRENTERPETIALGANRLGGVTPGGILAAAREALHARHTWRAPYGSGDAAAAALTTLAAAGAA